MNQLIAFLGALVFVASCGGSVDPVGEQRHVEGMGDSGVFVDAGMSPVDAGDLDAGVEVDAAAVESSVDAGVEDAGLLMTLADAGLGDGGAVDAGLSEVLDAASEPPEEEPEPVATDAGGFLEDAGTSENHALQITVNPLVERSLRVGGQRQLVLDLSLLATTEDLQVRQMAVYFSCAGGSMVGSSGAYYFNHFTLEDLDTGEVLFGPRDFAPRSPPPSEPIGGVNIGFLTTIDLFAGRPRRIGYMLDVAGTIDAPGELIGLTCQAAMFEGFGVNSSVFNFVTNEYLTSKDMNLEQVFSDEVVVSGAAWGAFSFCDAGGGFEGCCTTGGFARDEPHVLSGMLVKSNTSPHVYYVASDGQRYVFPTRTEFFSWYGWESNDPTERPTVCRNVREFPSSVISDIPIGQRIRIRPGTYLLKISTDYYLHAIARRGTLKKFWSWYPEGCNGGGYNIGDPMCGGVGSGPSSGDAAHQLFPNAEARVRTISDDCYLSYTVEGAIGDPPVPVGDYDPSAEYDWGSPNTMEAELGLLNP